MRRTFLILRIIALVVACNNLMAQDDKTSYDRSRKISDQLKNGTAPGLKFGPTAKKSVIVTQSTTADKSVSVGKQLKSGTMKGATIAQGGGAPAARRMSLDAKSRGASSNLSSDKPAAKVPNQPAKVEQPAISNQGGGSGTAIGLPVKTKALKPEVKATPGKE